jgi:hypothetical protein
METLNQWRRCSACKEPIEFGSLYFTCNVSTCNRKRTALAFCSVSCWEVHLPIERHREAWAEEQRAPASAQAAAAAAERKPRARTKSTTSAKPGAAPGGAPRGEVLIVASRLKDYIRTQSGFNTSDAAVHPLSDAVRRWCDGAIRNARRAEQKTVMGRDVPSD